MEYKQTYRETKTNGIYNKAESRAVTIIVYTTDKLLFPAIIEIHEGNQYDDSMETRFEMLGKSSAGRTLEATATRHAIRFIDNYVFEEEKDAEQEREETSS